MFRPLRPRHAPDAPFAAALRALSAALLMAAACCPPASAATEESQGWMTQSVTAQASEEAVIVLDIGHRFRRDDSSGDQQIARILIDHGVAPGVQLGGGVAYLHSGPEQELRLFQQATLSKGLWLARTRLEQRFFDTANRASWRLRQRVQAAVPLGSSRQWTLIAATEIMFHMNRLRPGDRTGLATMRNQIGLRRPIGPSLEAQLLYMRQQNFRDRRADAVAHVPWLTLNWRL